MSFFSYNIFFCNAACRTHQRIRKCGKDKNKISVVFQWRLVSVNFLRKRTFYKCHFFDIKLVWISYIPMSTILIFFSLIYTQITVNLHNIMFLVKCTSVLLWIRPTKSFITFNGWIFFLFFRVVNNKSKKKNISINNKVCI